MGPLQKLETKLDELLNKKAPYQIPENGRKSLADVMWIIALVFGIIQLWAAWGLWKLGHYADKLVDWANSLSVAYGVEPDVTNLGFFFYLSLGILIADAILLLLAVQGLKAKTKSGWNLLFYSVLLNLAYGAIRIFSEVGGGAGSFLWAVISFVIGAYLLFQIRAQFTSVKQPASTVPKPAAEVDDKKPTPKA